MQLEINSIDIAQPEALIISKAGSKSAIDIIRHHICKGDVLTTIFVVNSEVQQRLETAGDLIIKWKREG